MSDSTPAGEISEADEILLSAYVDGELTETERAGLEQRLKLEPRLQAELESLRAHGSVLKALDPGESQTTAGFKAFRNTLATAAPDEIPTAPALPAPRVRRFLVIGACLFFALLLPVVLKQIANKNRATEISAWRLEKLDGRGHVERGGRVYEISAGEWLHLSDTLMLEPNGREDGVAVLKGPYDSSISAEIDARLSPSLLVNADNSVRLDEGRFTVEYANEEAAKMVKLSTPDGTVNPQGKAPWKMEVAVTKSRKP